MEVWKACGTIYEHMVAEIRTGAKGEGEAVAQVWDGPEGFSRAKIMAAAPELLHAAEIAVEAFSTFGTDLECEVALKALKAAVSKAGR